MDYNSKCEENDRSFTPVRMTCANFVVGKSGTPLQYMRNPAVLNMTSKNFYVVSLPARPARLLCVSITYKVNPEAWEDLFWLPNLHKYQVILPHTCWFTVLFAVNFRTVLLNFKAACLKNMRIMITLAITPPPKYLIIHSSWTTSVYSANNQTATA